MAGRDRGWRGRPGDRHLAFLQRILRTLTPSRWPPRQHKPLTPNHSACKADSAVLTPGLQPREVYPAWSSRPRLLSSTTQLQKRPSSSLNRPRTCTRVGWGWAEGSGERSLHLCCGRSGLWALNTQAFYASTDPTPPQVSATCDKVVETDSLY